MVVTPLPVDCFKELKSMHKLLIILPLAVLGSTTLSAQEFRKTYTFNTSDKTTYSTSCGTIEPPGWAVIRNSCNFYTPVTGVGGTTGEADRLVDIRMRLGNSNNLDAKDFAWLFYYVNGKMVLTRTFKGDNTPSSFEFSDSLIVPAGGTYKLRIALVCDEMDEYWRLMNGDLTATVRSEGEAAPPPSVPLSHDPGLTALRDGAIARLSWGSAPDESASYFLIEKSRDGQKFEFAAYLRNDNTNQTSYSYIDHELFKPETWYRVTRVAANGKKVVIGQNVKLEP
jgi:hypothetical protein